VAGARIKIASPNRLNHFQLLSTHNRYHILRSRATPR
jgi:hypothetical protein